MNGKWKSLGAGLNIRERYRLMRALKPGGGGPVFSALQAGTKKIFQVRFYSDREIPDEMALGFRVKKAQNARELCGEAVLAPAEFGFYKEVPFVVYDATKLKSLEELLKPGQAVMDHHALRSFVEALLRMLEAAHGGGVAHLGLSPLSVCWKGEEVGKGSLAVLDFGVTHLAGAAYFTYPGTADPELLPVAAYAAPEQAAGKEKPDQRVDLYSAGALIYRLLTGRPPFTGSNSGQILDKVLFGEPPEFEGGAPGPAGAIDRFLRRALHKNPAERFQSAAAMREAFLGAMSSADTGETISREDKKTPIALPAISLKDRAIRSDSEGETAMKTPKPTSLDSLLSLKPSQVATLPPVPKKPGEVPAIVPLPSLEKKAQDEGKGSAWTWVAFMVILVGIVSAVLYFTLFRNWRGEAHGPPTGAVPAITLPAGGGPEPVGAHGQADAGSASDAAAADQPVSEPGPETSAPGAAAEAKKKKKTVKKKKKTTEETGGEVPPAMGYVD